MATRPSPPGRFSTTTGWPQRLAKRSAISRVPISTPLPAPSVTMNLTGRCGQICAAVGSAASTSAETRPSARPNTRRCMPSTSVVKTFGSHCTIGECARPVVLAQADTHDHRLWTMGHHFSVDDGNSRRGGLVPRVRGDQRLAHAHDAIGQAVPSDALRGDAGAFQHQVQFLGERIGVVKSRGATHLGRRPPRSRRPPPPGSPPDKIARPRPREYGPEAELSRVYRRLRELRGSTSWPVPQVRYGLAPQCKERPMKTLITALAVLTLIAA